MAQNLRLEKSMNRLALFESFYKEVGSGDVVKGLEKARLQTLKLMAELAASDRDAPEVLRDLSMDVFKYIDLLDNLIENE